MAGLFRRAIISSKWMQPIFVFCLLSFLATSHIAVARASTNLECNPNQVKMSCIMGCFGCFEAFGIETYDMAACCRDCRLTDADVIDDGPSKCSRDYIRRSWLKRFG